MEPIFETIHNVLVLSTGPDQHEIGDPSYLPDHSVFVVYDYTRGDYDGSGSAVAITRNGEMYEKGLSHCSCFGAFGYDSGSWVKVDSSIDFRNFLRIDEHGVDRSSGYGSQQWSRMSSAVEKHWDTIINGLVANQNQDD